MTLPKLTFEILGGVVGWLVGRFEPVFPLVIVMVLFVLYDAWTAYQLSKRVKILYPRQTKRQEAKFTSFAFGKVVRQTIPHRLCVILLAFLAEKYVFVHVDSHLSYVVTGMIIFEQALSALENNMSSPLHETDSRLWKMLHKFLIDKTGRHFDTDLDEWKIPHYVTEEQVESMRQRVAEWDEKKENAV